MKNDHDPRFLSGTQVSSQEDCQKACCLNGKNSRFKENFWRMIFAKGAHVHRKNSNAWIDGLC